MAPSSLMTLLAKVMMETCSFICVVKPNVLKVKIRHIHEHFWHGHLCMSAINVSLPSCDFRVVHLNVQGQSHLWIGLASRHGAPLHIAFILVHQHFMKLVAFSFVKFSDLILPQHNSTAAIAISNNALPLHQLLIVMLEVTSPGTPTLTTFPTTVIRG